MAYRNVDIRSFGGGLNLRDGADTVSPSQAIDCLNVLYTPVGAVQQRPGYVRFTAAQAPTRVDSLGAFYKDDDTTAHLVAGAGSNLVAWDATGAQLQTVATTTGPHTFARFGGATPTQYLYCANGTDTLRVWNGTAFSTLTYTGHTPTGRVVSTTPWDNRLVSAGYSGATAGANPSTVRFSAAGDTTTFDTNDYVDLNPGDGEGITAVVPFREQLLVFKQSSFYRFYGTSVDAEGRPLFNYVPVHSNVGCVGVRAVAVAPDGVYFLDRKGVYRTTGGDATPVSELIAPMFTGDTGPYYTGGPVNQALIEMSAVAYADHRVYVAVPTAAGATNDRVLVYSPEQGWWSVYDIGAAALCAFRAGGGADELLFGYSAANANVTYDVGRYSERASARSDDGYAVRSAWQSGWFDFGSRIQKTVRESKLVGEGRVQLGWSRDWQGRLASKTVTFGSSNDLWGDGTTADTWGGPPGETPPPPSGTPPIIFHGTVTNITSTTADVVDVVNIEGSTTIYYVQYGTTSQYGQVSPSSTLTQNGYTGAHLTGLTPGTIYHYRAVATNDDGTTIEAADHVFTTLDTGTGSDLWADGTNANDKWSDGTGGDLWGGG